MKLRSAHERTPCVPSPAGGRRVNGTVVEQLRAGSGENVTLETPGTIRLVFRIIEVLYWFSFSLNFQDDIFNRS